LFVAQVAGLAQDKEADGSSADGRWKLAANHQLIL
jgi:hypothetical protein